ncbi:MAG: hypothetical protein QOI12_1138 [Alphaproteobacteria bacterium]|jgi:2-hydroxychromene-2-carboxylate isomerase|nr:hypothetical protein [Alphaproteobacteria bacterium]
MPEHLDFWFDFASTYSYPAAMRIGPLAAAAGVVVRFRPFLLGPIFKTQGWDSSPFNVYPAKGHNMWRDLERLCADMSLRFRRPDPFPQNSLLAARTALAALEAGWGEDFCRAIFQAEFADGRDIGEPSAVADVLTRLGYDAAQIIAEAQTETIKTRLRHEVEKAQRLGIFGAPSFVTSGGELFWGNDRLERALLWAGQGR